MQKTAKNILRRISVTTRVLIRRLLGISDSPHRIALGVAIGLFVAWMPTYGLHTLTVLMLTFLLRANKVAGLTSMLVTNPLTAGPAYYFSYILGGRIIAIFTSQSAAPIRRAAETFHPLSISALFSARFWDGFWEWLVAIGTELWIGGLVIGILSACAGYLIAFWLVAGHRKKHPLTQPGQ